MKNGFKVFDTDTHVLPAAEVIERYVDPDFRPRLKELDPYRTPMRQSAEYPASASQQPWVDQLNRPAAHEIPDTPVMPPDG